MSVVYKARQPGLGRVVALKRLAPRGQGVPDTARFLREAAAVARMHHPNIVQVREVGDDGGQPFLALEYVPGGTLAEYLRGRPADPRVAAEMLEQVGRAVHHAHERGIVHRDLKPSNILLAGNSEARSPKSEQTPNPPGSSFGLRASEFSPKVSDFGLARGVVEDQSLTLPGVLVGTPAYVAPEAIRSPMDPTPAGDVYALGVILYEMLTGHPPLIGPTVLDTLRLVESVAPVPPTHLQLTLPRDLETICLACLRKDPRRRYTSALALAEDLRRFLDGRPILARRVGRLETAWLWCRRNRAVAALGAALAGSVLAGLVVALVLLGNAHRSAEEAYRSDEEARRSAEDARRNEIRARRAADAADVGARLANDRAYSSDLQYANEMWANRQLPVLIDLLDSQRPEVPGRRGPGTSGSPRGGLYGDRADLTDRRGFEWYFLWALAHSPHRTAALINQALALATGTDSRYLAVAVGEGGVELIDASGKSVRTLTGGKVIRVRVSTDGQWVAGAGEDGIVRVWVADTGRVLHTLEGHRGPVVGLSFHPDGKRLVTAGVDGTVRVWDLVNPATVPRVVTRGAGRLLVAIFSPDGARLAVGGADGDIRVWDTSNWVEQPSFWGHTGDVTSLAFAPDSSRLASGSFDQSARVWDVGTGKPVRTVIVHRDAVTSVAFSPDGRSLATASIDRSAAVTDLETGLPSHVLLGHTGIVVGVAFSPDGKTLASTGWDKTIRLWDLAAPSPFRRWRGHTRPIRATAFSPDGTMLATGSLDGTVRIWDPETGTERRAVGGHTDGVLSVAFDPAGRLATAAGDNKVTIWDAGTGQLLHTLTGHTERINEVRFGPGGRSIAGAGEGGTVYLWKRGRGLGWSGAGETADCGRVPRPRLDRLSPGRWGTRWDGHGSGRGDRTNQAQPRRAHRRSYVAGLQSGWPPPRSSVCGPDGARLGCRDRETGSHPPWPHVDGDCGAV